MFFFKYSRIVSHDLEAKGPKFIEKLFIDTVIIKSNFFNLETGLRSGNKYDAECLQPNEYSLE